jgi:hypothetical protein
MTSNTTNTVCIRGVKKEDWRYLKSQAAKTDSTLGETLSEIISTYKQNPKVLINLSKKMGIGDEALVRRAILFYTDSVKREMELRREMSGWDSLSDEALSDFEENP